MNFHDKLSTLRHKHRLSQEALAEMIQVSRQAISKWESASAYPEIEKLVLLSDLFGVTIDSLLKEGPLQYTTYASKFSALRTLKRFLQKFQPSRNKSP